MSKSINERAGSTSRILRSTLLCAAILLTAHCGSGTEVSKTFGETTQVVLDATYFQYPLGPTPAGYTVAQWNANNATQNYFSFGSLWDYSPTIPPYSVRCGGLLYRHAGRDAPAKAGDPVWAVANGKVVAVEPAGGTNWGSIILVEHHNVPGVGTVVSNYTHTKPWVVLDQEVVKGQQIATVFNVSPNHLHFGIWQAGFVSNLSDKGALPQVTGCGLPVFQSSFVNPDDFVSAHYTCSPSHNAAWWCHYYQNLAGSDRVCGPNYTNDCNQTIDCGSCQAGTTCSNGLCAPNPPTCPSGRCGYRSGWCGVGAYCGSSGVTNGTANALYQCKSPSGLATVINSCGGYQCIFRPGLDDVCAFGPTTCPVRGNGWYGPGLYCGRARGMGYAEPYVVYSCSGPGRAASVNRTCSSSCVVAPNGYNDHC